MNCRRKACLCALLCGALFLMLVTHGRQKWPPGLQRLAPAGTRLAARGQTRNQTRAPPARSRPSCGCPSCVSERGRSPWFDQRFDARQLPFLTAQNGSVLPSALRWWLALQRSSDAQEPYRVIQKMFRVVSEPPPHEPAVPARCRRCAVVGNSGNLRGSHNGPLVDSHDTVIRMNKATTLGFEADVGNRTTHHFMYPESAVDLPPGVWLVLLPFKLRDLQWLASALSTGEIKTTYMRVKERVRADKDKVIVVNPAFFKYTHDSWTEHHGRYPSTGMLAIIFALHICDEVSVFGYGADPQGNWHHYWEDNKYAGAFRKTGVHNADFETHIILKLHSEGKIKLHR